MPLIGQKQYLKLEKLNLEGKTLLLINKVESYLKKKVKALDKKNMPFFCRRKPKRLAVYKRCLKEIKNICSTQQELERDCIHSVLTKVSLVIDDLKSVNCVKNKSCVTKTFKSDEVSSMTERFFEDPELKAAGLKKDVTMLLGMPQNSTGLSQAL